MIFKVSKIRKIIESLIISIIWTLVLSGLIPQIRNYSNVIFLISFIMIVALAIRTKDIYSIQKGVLTIFEGNIKSNILIKDISFVECSTCIGIDGEGIQEEYSIITKDSKYKLDERLRNENGKTLIYVLEHLYNKKIKELSK